MTTSSSLTPLVLAAKSDPRVQVAEFFNQFAVGGLLSAAVARLHRVLCLSLTLLPSKLKNEG